MTINEKAKAATMSLVGEAITRFESSQGFRINGKIIERLVETGSLVKKGQVLARLDPKDPQLAATSSLADVNAAAASLALATAEVKRHRQLAARKFVSASALDIKEAELKTAAAKLSQLKAQANVAGNQATYSLLKADRAGVVTMIRAEPGQVVESGEVIAKIADTNNTEILISVPESHISQVRLHDPVRIGFWANPQKIYSGKVREIAPAGQSSTRTFNVRVMVNDADAQVRLGMTARVSFSYRETPENTAILIPSAALTELNGKKIVWIIDAENKAQPREVTTGAFGESGIPVFSGLSAGERIAVAGVHTLTQGQPVNPVVAAP